MSDVKSVLNHDINAGCVVGGIARKMRRRGASITPRMFCNMIKSDTEMPIIGALPYKLRERVADGDLSRATYKMNIALSDFLDNNMPWLRRRRSVGVFDLDTLSELFSTPCHIELRNSASSDGQSAWHGQIATVGKLSFPKIGASYALKFFYNVLDGSNGHGPWREIPTAFGANQAEARDNNRVHLAGVGGKYPFILSDWAGDNCDGIAPRQNKYPIYTMSIADDNADNYRHGRRIDFGKTYLTPYGMASYRVRKIFRQLMWAAEHGSPDQIRAIMACTSKYQRRQELQRAIDLVHCMADINVSRMIMGECR